MAEINSFEKVRQTYKTIIFEEFDKESKDNFYSLLDLTDEPTSEAFKDDLDKKLVVHSYDEFLRKFMPKVYEICTSNNEGNIKYVYTTDAIYAKKNGGIAVNITDHAYYKMLVQMYTEKGSSGESNLHFDTSKILEMITPKKEAEEAQDIRKKLSLSVEKYLDLKDKGENPAEYANKIVDCRKKIAQKYKDSTMGLLPLAIADVKTKLKYLNQTAPEQNENVDGAQNYTAQISFANDGRLIVEQKEIKYLPDDEQVQNDRNVPALIKTTIENDYEQQVEGEGNQFVKDLIVRAYAPLDVSRNTELATVDEQRQEYKSLINDYEKIYSQAKESFMKEMTSIIEKMLGIKVFFDNATAKGTLKEGVLITNCRADKLISSNVKDKFEKFMMDKGINQPKQKIWFAVLPAVAEKLSASSSNLSAFDPFAGSISNKDDDTVKEEDLGKGECISFNAAKAVLEIMNKSKIMTIFNFKASEENGFAKLSSSYISEKIDQMTDGKLAGDHMVFAYPNFTLNREHTVTLDSETIKIPNVYIEASYPAAALLVASQQIEYLEAHGFKGRINYNNVCVHINLEKPDIKKNIITNFNQEVSLRWSQDIRDTINRSDFGFVFCGDEIYIDDKPLKNAYVYLARTLQKNAQGRYKPIYHVLTEDFIRQYLSASNTRITKDMVDTFINKKEVKIWENECKKKDSKNIINLILSENDKITYDEGSGKIKIKFGNDEAVLDDISIEAE